MLGPSSLASAREKDRKRAVKADVRSRNESGRREKRSFRSHCRSSERLESGSGTAAEQEQEGFG
eukprot:166481-Rhodomonas_salina.1